MIYITSHVIPQYSWFGKMVLNKNFVILFKEAYGKFIDKGFMVTL